MQLSGITTGAVIGTAVIRNSDQQPGAAKTFTADIRAGRVLRTGVTDIAKAGWELVLATHKPFEPTPSGGPTTWGSVGFVRNGDAWDAVELLAPERPGGQEKVMWLPSSIETLQLAPGVQFDAFWQVSHYGGDYTRFMDGVIAKAGV